MPNTLNDIFAHLDNAKASRAYETNQERRRKVEEAERERKVKQAAESAVEKYHVYDDDYDVEDVEEPLVMIPKQNPGTPEAKAATMPASKKDMDDIADNNPFVQNLFKRSHKQVRQERPAREKLAASTNTAKAPQTLAAPASEPTAPQSETFNVPVTPVPVQPVAPSAPASTVPPAVPETVDTVDFVDDIPSTSSLTIPRQTSRTSSQTRAFRTKPFPRSLWPLRMQKPFLFQTSLLLSPRMYLLRNPLFLLRIWMRVPIPKRKSLRRIPDIMSLLVRWSFPIRSRNSWKLPHGLTA